MSKVDEIYRELCKPFTEDEIKWRVQSSGFQRNGAPWARIIPYVTSRAVQKRLDHIFGFDGWKAEYRELSSGGMICALSVRVGDAWVTKENGSGESNIEKEKGAISGAFKRAAVEFGVARYLYDLGERFAVFVQDGKYKSQIKDKQSQKQEWKEWNPPQLPDWALPEQKNNYEKAADYKAKIINELELAIKPEEVDTILFHYRDAIDRIRARGYNDLSDEIDETVNRIKMDYKRNGGGK